MDAKAYYADQYHIQLVPSPQSYWLYGYIRGLGDIGSVFEFGCNAGRHLYQLQRQGCRVAGIDINDRAIEAARIHNRLDLRCGDESELAHVPAKSFDLTLTVSALSHMEDINDSLVHLERIASKHVILVETRTRADHQRFWWVHEYPGTPVYEYYAGQVNAVYQVWHSRK